MKKFISLITCLTISLCCIPNVYAANNKVNTIDVSDISTLKIETSNSVDKIDYSVTEINEHVINSTDDLITVQTDYEVFFEIPTYNDSVVSPTDNEDKTKNKDGCTAKVSLTYTYKSSNDTINITRASGSWVGNSSLYYMQKREVIVRSDSISSGKRVVYNPTSDTFSYNIKWGYVDYFPNTSYSMTGMSSSAEVHVVGMSAYTTISISLVVSV